MFPVAGGALRLNLEEVSRSPGVCVHLWTHEGRASERELHQQRNERGVVQLSCGMFQGYDLLEKAF